MILILLFCLVLVIVVLIKCRKEVRLFEKKYLREVDITFAKEELMKWSMLDG